MHKNIIHFKLKANTYCAKKKEKTQKIEEVSVGFDRDSNRFEVIALNISPVLVINEKKIPKA